MRKFMSRKRNHEIRGKSFSIAPNGLQQSARLNAVEHRKVDINHYTQSANGVDAGSNAFNRVHGRFRADDRVASPRFPGHFR